MSRDILRIRRKLRMPEPITCSCGARFEAEEVLPGQVTHCPECRKALNVGGAELRPRRTSLLALFSVIFALVGAFTVVGTTIAALLGLAGLIRVARNRERLAGSGLATFGMIAGVALTGLTIFALSRDEFFGLSNPNRARLQVRDLDTSGPLEVQVVEKGFAIRRPSARWGTARVDSIMDPFAAQFCDDADLLLINPGRYLIVDVRVVGPGKTIDHCFDEVLMSLRSGRMAIAGISQPVRAAIRESYDLPAEDWKERREFVVDINCGAQAWIMVLRFQKAASGEVYITRAYTLRRRFAAAAAELREALDSFHLVQAL